MARSDLTLTLGRRPAVKVLRANRPDITAVTVPGPQGAPGAAGSVGSYGLGQITYTERVLEASDTFEPGVRGQVLFEPTSVQDYLNPPFDGHAFWVDNRVVARALGDLYDFQVNLIVTAQVAGGEVRLEADVGSALGPVAADTQSLFAAALEPERVTFRLRVQALAGFLANGCAFYLTSSVPITTISETVLVAPASIWGLP